MDPTTPQERNDDAGKATFHRALIVDDNPAVVAALATRLWAAGWDSITALDGHDAMQLMSSHPPDAVVTDIDMPYIDGFGIIELALSFQQCPVLAITGSPNAAERCRSDYPKVPVVMKPFDATHIIRFLESLGSENPHQKRTA